MAWHGDQMDRIAGSEELQITTTRPDGTQRRWTPIWVVRVGDGLYVRSAAGGSSDWYRHTTQLPQFLRPPATGATLQLEAERAGTHSDLGSYHSRSFLCARFAPAG